MGIMASSVRTRIYSEIIFCCMDTKSTPAIGFVYWQQENPPEAYKCLWYQFSIFRMLYIEQEIDNEDEDLLNKLKTNCNHYQGEIKKAIEERRKKLSQRKSEMHDEESDMSEVEESVYRFELVDLSILPTTRNEEPQTQKPPRGFEKTKRIKRRDKSDAEDLAKKMGKLSLGGIQKNREIKYNNRQILV